MIADHANSTHTGCLSHSKKEPGSQRIERDLRFFTVNTGRVTSQNQRGRKAIAYRCQITLNELLLVICITFLKLLRTTS
ncbi:hypothetical protein WN51_08428 [Melipona quadrifasciata]|uniref:Uncharacterized protein n=1 Tax=Melipona quadrifasciata TaxID=166423 RepID=A0A0N0U7G1_9HYME|nr:hypothetical protein WN51_08428 [Melipona quadrifasciata]